MADDGQVIIKVKVETDDANKKIDGIKKSLMATDLGDGIKVELDDVSKSAKSAGKEIDDFGNSAAGSRRKTDEDSQSLDKNKKSFKELQGQIKLSASAYKILSEANDKVGNKYQANVYKLKSYNKSLEEVSNTMKRQSDSIDKLKAEHGEESNEVKKATASYKVLEANQQQLVLSSQKLYKAYGNITPKMAEAADKAVGIGNKFKAVGDRIDKIGDGMSKRFTVPIVTALGYATKSAIDFESQIQSMGSLLDDGSVSASALKKELENLGSASKKWSTQYGVSTTKINSGMEELIKKGYSYNQVLGAMPSLLNASRASGDDFNEVMSVSTSTLEQFGLKSNDTAKMLKNTQRVTDGLTYVANKTSAGFSDMGYAMEYVGPVAHGLNISLEQTASAIGLMSNQGIEGQKAGTALRGALSALLTPSRQNREGFDKLGISVEAFKKGTITLPDIIDSIKTKSSGMTKQQLQSNLALAFGTEAQSGMNILVNEGGDALRNLTGETKNATGYTKKLADTMNQTSQANAQKLKESLHVLAITAGQELVPEVNDIIKNITSLLKQFNDLDDGTKKMIVNTALVVAAGGPALSLIGNISKGLGNIILTGPKMLNFFAKVKNGTSETSTVLKVASKSAEELGAGTEIGAKGATKLATKTAEAGTKTGLFGRTLTALIPELGATGVSLGSLLLPIAGVTAAFVGVAAVSYFAIKAHNEHEKKIKEYKKTLDEYGVNVSQNTQKAMKSFNDLSKSATNDMALLDSTTNDQSKQLSSDVVSKYDKMATIVTGRFDKMKTDSEKSIKQLNSDLGAVGDQMTKNVNGHIDDVTGDSTKEVKEAQATIHRIYKQVGGDLSQMNSTQKHSFEDAQSLITEQTSAFAISLRDQQALLNAYKNQHGNITTKMYREDIKKQENAHHETYETAKKEQDKELAQLKKDHKAHLITDKQYQDESTVSLNKYQAKITKSNIVYYKDQDTTYKHYKDTGTQFLATKQSIYEASTQIDSKGQKTYKSVMTGSYVSRAQWIEEAKTQNAKYIKQQKELHGTAESNLDSYYKKQVSFYEKMGLSRKEAIVQATADRDNIESETDKTASNIAAEAEKIQKSYIKGLQSNKNGTPAEVASKWGLDITSKVKNIDLGKYGKKSAKQLWTDFTSGSKDGQEEAKLYYLQMFQDWKSNGKKSIKDLTDDNKTALHEGLESGVLSIKNLKNKYGKAIFDLFPSDMSKIPDQEIKSLKSAYENNVVSLNDLKNKFGDKIYQIFPNDLSDLGKKEVDTLNEGLQNGQIKSSELKAKFGPQLEAIYKKDLSDVGQDDIDTLQTALDLGITNKSDLQQKFGSTIDRIYNQTPKLNKISKANISTLQQAMSLGITNTQDIEDKYKFQLNQIYNKDLTDLGKGQIETLADGLKLGLPSVQAEMKKIQGQINKNATVDLKGKGKFNIESLAEGLESGKLSVSQFMSGLNKLVKKSAEIDLTDKGSNAIQTYADGANGNIGSATKAISNVRTQSESGLTPTGLPYQHGADITTSYGSGIYDMISNPLGNALLVHDGSIAQLQPSDLAKKYGADKSTAFGNGILTNSGLPLSVSASIANGVNGNFNDGIDSANNVSNQLGSKSSYKKHTSKTKTSLPSATPWKTGTNGKIASLTPSIVGDGYEPELIDYGNGSLELSPAVPTFRMLNPGAQVFSGSDTKIISNALNGMGISMFANGTGGNVGEWISNTAKTSWDWIKNVSGDLIDWISKPKETWSKLIEGQFDSSAFSGNAASIGTGTKSTEKKQTNWLDKLVKSIMSTGGSYDPAMIIKAAAIMGVHPTDSFIKMLQATIQSESGGRSVTQQIHDTNSGGQEAAGILQYTPGTFATFAMPGHTNRMNPFDELLAFFNNSDWANSIGPTVIWGTPKIDWLHSGPQGHRRMNQGGHVYSPETIDIAEKGKDEFVINPWESTASGLTTELLQRINDVQPNALGKIVLPGQGVSPESISKFKSLPVSRNSDNQAIDNLDANNSNSEGIIASLIQKFDNLVESLSGDTTVNINVDGVSLATATFPKMKLLMNDYINAEMTRRGR